MSLSLHKYVLSAIAAFSACFTYEACAGWGFGDIIEGRTTREIPVFSVGETMTFKFNLRGFKGLDASKCYFDWVRTGDDGVTKRGKAVASRPLVLSTSIDRPGFVRYYVELHDQNGNPILRDVMDDGDNYKVRFDGGAGAQIFQIRPAVPEPEDFDAFWHKMKSDLNNVDWKGNVKLKQLDSEHPDIELYSVESPCAGGRPATGFLTVPAKARSGARYPADVSFYGYGGSWSKYATQKPAPKRLRTDVIQFLSSAHGFELMRESAYYENMRKSLSSNGYGYCFDPKENSDPQKCYFKGMVLRVLRGIEYLKSRPEWNGRDLVVHGGSMGGLQTIWAAALDKDVTVARAEAPWCCDIGGTERGRSRGDWYVKWVPALGYYDPVNFASRIPKTCFFDMPRIGLGDYVCPPVGVMSFYNSLKCPKRGIVFQNTRHDYKAPEPLQQFVLLGDKVASPGENGKSNAPHEDGANYNLRGVK